jgi:anti-sigma factor RsiW
MIDRESPVTEDELHAFVDGELPVDRKTAVEAWLASHPDDAARVGAWKVQAAAIRTRFSGTANEAVPSHLKVDSLLRSGRNWRTIAAAAAAAAFLIGGVAGWMARDTTEVTAAPGDPTDQIAQYALAAHKLYIGEIRHPVEVAATEAHLTPWLSRRLGTTLRIPDFSAFDMKLLGGRLLPGENGPAALIMYENGNGDRITFYCTKLPSQQMAFRYYQSDNVAAIRWVVGDYGYVVSGPADKMRLKEFAKAAFEQLENRAPPPHPNRSSNEPLISRRGT